jgi:hypothetical protein
MAVTVKKIVLWRKEVENRPAALASTLASLASAGTDLQVVMAFRYPGEESKAAIELYPVIGHEIRGRSEGSRTHCIVHTGFPSGGRQPARPGPCDLSSHCRCPASTWILLWRRS